MLSITLIIVVLLPVEVEDTKWRLLQHDYAKNGKKKGNSIKIQ
jgi:hypothetical protein